MVRAVTPIPFVKARFFDRCGKPLTGGKVYTYEANTTTAKTTYKDPYGLTPNTNPIILDAAGEADIYLDGTYRIRITDRNDVLVNDVAKIGSWFSDNLQDTLDNISGAMDDAIKPALQSLDDAINIAAAAGAGAKGWTANLIVDNASGKTQHEINSAVLQTAYYASLEGFRTSLDNSDAWDVLQAKMQDGDTLIFDKGTYRFSRPFTINKAIKVTGQGLAANVGTSFSFSGTHGIVRNVRGGELIGLRILGTQTTTAFDFLNNVFGNVGLWDKYDDTAKAGYINTRNLHISGFDVGRVNATGGSEIWNGAYRETYDTFIQLNRCGCVFINGATHDKYYGGVISANSEIGIWAEAPRVQYNNINFIGTTIEGNGSFDLSTSINNIDYKNNISIFAGANTTINLIGSYCEAMMSYAKDGGVINKIGSYEHYNSLNYANNGTINIVSSNLGNESKVTFIPKERVLWSRMARGTLAPLTFPDGVVATANMSSSDGFALISRPIALNSAVKNKDINRIRVSFSYKFTSGFTANQNLYIIPKMNLYSKTTGKVDTVPGGIFPTNMLMGRANGEQQSFEYYYKPGNSLDADGYFDAIELYFNIMNGGGYPDFTSDNLRLEVYNVAISVITNKPLDIVFNVDKGNNLQRPMLNTEDRGYQYYDYSEGSLLVWNGEDWLDNLTATITTTSALKAIGNPINTARKYVGKTVYCTDTTKFYMAVGNNSGSAWIPTDGTPVIIPV